MSQTWIIKDTAPVDEASWPLSVDIAFTSHGNYYTGIEIGSFPTGNFLRYTISEGGVIDIASFTDGSPFVWYDDAYKTLVFDTAPTGDLLTWLQKNADKYDQEYLTRKSELTSVADAIRAKSGTSDPLVYPNGFVTAIQSIDTTGGLKPATVTITSSASGDTGNVHGMFIFTNSRGHIDQLNYMFNDTFTYPITIETVIGGMVVLTSTGPRGSHTYTGCEISSFQGVVCILLTSPQASVDLYNPGD